MADLYDRVATGQMARIKGRLAVFLYYASYGGGSGPLWAVEGVSVQFARRREFAYRRGTCRRVTSEFVDMELEDGRLESIPVADIGRYDQHHLSAGRFSFDTEDVVLLSPDSFPDDKNSEQ